MALQVAAGDPGLLQPGFVAARFITKGDARTRFPHVKYRAACRASGSPSLTCCPLVQRALLSQPELFAQLRPPVVL